MTIDSPVTEIKGVGAEMAKKFASVGVNSIGELLEYLPRRYEDYSHVTPIKLLHPGLVTVEATIKQAVGRYVRRGMHITEAIASDDTDSVRLVWFNQPYRANALKAGQKYFISGQYELKRNRFAMMNPSVELMSDFPVNTARIIPVYRETKGLTSKQIRKAIAGAITMLEHAPETMPAWIVEGQDLIPHSQAIQTMHFPESSDALDAARLRLGFEEVFELSMAALLNKYELLQDTSVAIPFDEQLAKKFVSHLPFTLTDAQRKVVWHVYQDMQRTQPMNRLVEGDVGSGKTVVATMAALMAMSEGYQVALMAPTELLARQHAETIYKLLEPLDMHHKLSLLVGGMTTKQKDAAREHIARGNVQFMVGTQALIQESVDMHQLGLVVIDEQHRFGVEQRQRLMAKAGHMPHLLSLTATPIPRSLALTLYGELDISVIDVKPAGRQPVETRICSPNSREELYEEVEGVLKAGRQMFVVCPLISEQDESEQDSPRPTRKILPSAEKVHKELSTKWFKHRNVGLLHGKMKPQEKADIMEQFVQHKLDILVSTTVIEVGVDVPNASIMLLEAAERFGLAQVHQLRGRVGRGGHKGYCFLMMSDSAGPPQRLRALERTNDGFKLAELDLELRGPGAIYGRAQSGALDLRVAKLTDTQLIARARSAAQECIDKQEDLLQYPVLYRRISALRAVTNLN
jgi:ATP-dependent DNA helicase RecG